MLHTLQRCHSDDPAPMQKRPRRLHRGEEEPLPSDNFQMTQCFGFHANEMFGMFHILHRYHSDDPYKSPNWYTYLPS